MTVDDLFDVIPDAVREAARGFNQGDVIKEIPLAYHAVGKHAATHLARMAVAEVGLSILGADNDFFEYGIITTQTCDVTEEDSEHPRKPWIQVAPVYRYEELNERQRADVNALLIPNLIRLNGKVFEEAFYVADLRLSLPFEKSLLVDRTPIKGFSDEAGSTVCGALQCLHHPQRFAGDRERVHRSTY